MTTHAQFLKALRVVQSFWFKCCKCGYEWTPRTAYGPKKCPNKKCKSPNWNRGK